MFILESLNFRSNLPLYIAKYRANAHSLHPTQDAVEAPCKIRPSAKKSVTVQTNKQTNTQTANDMSTPRLSACVNNDEWSAGARIRTARCWKSHVRMMFVDSFGKIPRRFRCFLARVSSSSSPSADPAQLSISPATAVYVEVVISCADTVMFRSGVRPSVPSFFLTLIRRAAAFSSLNRARGDY